MQEVVHATGHEHVAAEHASTFEVTSDEYLTPAGDCILGIEADRTPADFDRGFVEACQSDEASIVATLDAAGYTERVEGRGDPELTLTSDRGLVCRTSDYIDDRTVMVGAEAAAADLNRELIAALADGADLTLTVAVE